MAPLDFAKDYFVYFDPKAKTSDHHADKPLLYGYAQESFYSGSERILGEIERLDSLEHLTQDQAQKFCNQFNEEEN